MLPKLSTLGNLQRCYFLLRFQHDQNDPVSGYFRVALPFPGMLGGIRLWQILWTTLLAKEPITGCQVLLPITLPTVVHTLDRVRQSPMRR